MTTHDLGWMLDWDGYKNGNAVRLLLHLLLLADESGQVEVSERGLAEALGVGRQAIRTAKALLLADQKITQVATHGKTTLTLCLSSAVVSKAQPRQPKSQPNKQPNKTVEVSPAWVAVEYAPVFLDWVDYKKSKGERYKNEKSLKACYNRLVNLSGGDAGVAAMIVEQSMANNWKGLFPLQRYNNGTNNRRSNSRDDELAAQAVRMRTDFESERAHQ